MTGFFEDREAVTAPLGMMMMLVVFLGVWSLYQTVMVPAWNDAEDDDLFNDVEADFLRLLSTIEDAIILESPRSTTINLGTTYSNKIFFVNPEVGVIGTLFFEPFDITVNYTRYGTPYSVTYSSARIIYTSSDLRQYPSLVYESGAIIYAFGENNRSFLTQTLIVNDELSIPLLNTSKSPVSAMGVETLQILRSSQATTLSNLEDVIVSIETKYPDAWTSLLSGTNTSDTTVNIVDGKIVIEADYVNQMVREVFVDTDPDEVYAGSLTFQKYADESWQTGVGQGLMGSGSQWSNIPSSSDITLIDAMNFIIDGSMITKLDSDIIWITIVDLDDGDWWKLVMEFQHVTNPVRTQIMDLYQKSKVGGSQESTWQVDGSDIGTSNALTFNDSTVIHLREASNYDVTDGLYQNADIGDSSILTSLLGDKSNLKDTALISVTLVIE